jgi:predicted naringenin-chalcone synthase
VFVACAIIHSFTKFSFELMPLFIHDIACAVPGYRYAQAHIAQFIAEAYKWQKDRLEAVKRFYKETDIHFRHSVLPDFEVLNADGILHKSLPVRMQIYRKEAAQLAINAITQSSFAHIHPDVLITVSCTGLSAPGWDVDVAQHFSWQPGWRTGVNFMGCHGLFHALQIADGIASGRTNAKIMIVAAELCTLHFNTIDRPDQHRAQALFADGACAIFCSGSEVDFPAKIALHAFQSGLIPDQGDNMAWEIGERTFLMNLSAGIPKLLRQKLAPMVASFCEKNGINQNDLSLYAIHPGGKRIITEVGELLSLSTEHLQFSKTVLQQFGNMSSASIGFVLRQMCNSSTNGAGLAFGFGPGLTVELMYFELIE